MGWSSATVGVARQASYLKRSLEMIKHRYPFVRLATYFVDHDRPPEFFQGLLSEEPRAEAGGRCVRTDAERLTRDCRPVGNR